MKKMFTALCILLFIFVSLQTVIAVNVSIVPYAGAYGVNMASNKYRGNENTFAIDKNYTWVEGSVNDASFNSLRGRTGYTDDMMIATGGVSGLTEVQGSYYILTATCENGFYFKSQSNPNFVRPFEIVIVTRFDENGPKTGYTDDVIVMNSSGDSEPVYYDDEATSDRMWFDLVLCLPLDDDPVAGTNYVEANDQRFPLVQADDYTALVTLNLTAYDQKGNILDTDTISIPFSGYYNGQITQGRNNDRMSLMFTPSGNAGNLNILLHAGTPMPVGKIDFLLDAGGNSYNYYYARIFLSSSNEPDDSTAQDFRLVHNSVGSSDTLTNYNSIGYSIVMMGAEGSAGTGVRTFEGSDYIDDNGNVSNAIVPRMISEQPAWGTQRTYFEYGGDIYVNIDVPETVMLPGDYHDRVYVHVVTDDAAGGA